MLMKSRSSCFLRMFDICFANAGLVLSVLRMKSLLERIEAKRDWCPLCESPWPTPMVWWTRYGPTIRYWFLSDHCSSLISILEESTCFVVVLLMNFGSHLYDLV